MPGLRKANSLNLFSIMLKLKFILEKVFVDGKKEIFVPVTKSPLESKSDFAISEIGF